VLPRIRHTEKVYVSGEVHTQTIEGFFSNLKRGINGNYHSVSSKWLQGYLNEYVWRYNHRQDGESELPNAAPSRSLINKEQLNVKGQRSPRLTTPASAHEC
jgi:hypothetical protein